MTTTARLTPLTLAAALAAAMTLSAQAPASQPPAATAASIAPFSVEEARIADIHAAMKAGRLTCRALVQAYLRRIEAYDVAVGAGHPTAGRRAGRCSAAATSGGPAGL